MNRHFGTLGRGFARPILPSDETGGASVTNGELREDGSFELREDGSFELRE